MKKQNLYHTIIVGAGASGLMAACELSKTTSSILILEKMNAPGKKILATGNGKCNMTNMHMDAGCFRGSGQPLAMYGLSLLSPDGLRDYFYQMGLFTMERNGYVYPVTEQAKTVLNTMLFQLKKNNIPIHLNEKVIKINQKAANDFEIETNQDTYRAKHIILACGGKANPKLGSDGSGYDLAKQLHLKIKKPMPALTALCSPKKIFKSLSGVRSKGCLSYFTNDGHYLKEEGELQLTAYGISGIPVFQISRFVINDLEQKKECEVEFDFFPEYTFQDLKNILKDFRHIPGMCCQDIISGLIHDKWVPVLLGESGINGKDAPKDVPEKKWNKLIQLFKQYPIPVNGYRDFEFAQASQGGVLSSCLSEELESRKHPGLYVTGELVDVDGTCGGYNLHWAFTSGYMAAKSIAGRQERKE